VQPHEGIRIKPMAAWPVPAINQGDAHVRMAGQSVGECHARRSGSDYQIVSLKRNRRRGHPSLFPPVGSQPTRTANDVVPACLGLDSSQLVGTYTPGTATEHGSAVSLGTRAGLVPHLRISPHIDRHWML
jgi:murein endopeptidase